MRALLLTLGILLLIASSFMSYDGSNSWICLLVGSIGILCLFLFEAMIPKTDGGRT